MIDYAIRWGIINFGFLIFFLYFIIQAFILLVNEKEILEKDTSVIKGLMYVSYYEIVLIFILFAKIIYFIFLKIDNIELESIKIRIETLEFFCFTPQLIEVFSLIFQISYYNSDNFIHKNEMLEIQSFYYYCKIKFIIGIIFCIWILGEFLLFSCYYFCLSCNFFKCYGQKVRIIRKNSRRRLSFSLGNNKVYAV